MVEPVVYTHAIFLLYIPGIIFNSAEPAKDLLRTSVTLLSSIMKSSSGLRKIPLPIMDEALPITKDLNHDIDIQNTH